MKSYSENDPVDILCKRIESAFDGVTLGNGIGLWEADSIDDNDDEETQAQNRARDEKEDWRKISVDTLYSCFSSPGFLDAAGFRFYLPALLIAELRGKYIISIVSALTSSSPVGYQKFELFSPDQRAVIREVLEFLRDDRDYEVDRALIDAALQNYWIAEPSPSSWKEHLDEGSLELPSRGLADG